MAKKIKRHARKNCPFLHVKKCPGCGRSCSCCSNPSPVTKPTTAEKLIDDYRKKTESAAFQDEGYKTQYDQGDADKAEDALLNYIKRLEREVKIWKLFKKAYPNTTREFVNVIRRNTK